MFATTEQVADFYEVDPEIVRTLVGLHRDEFESTGYRVITGAELRQVKAESQDVIKPSVRQFATWDRRAVLLLGMLLRDSNVAKAVRRYLLEAESVTHQVTTMQPTDTPVQIDSDLVIRERCTHHRSCGSSAEPRR